MAERRKATEERGQLAEECNKARGASERILEKPKKSRPLNTSIQETKELAQSKLSFKIVKRIYTKKKQPIIDNEIEDMFDAIPKRIRDTGKKTYVIRKEKGKGKQKMKYSIGHLYLV